jgi:hypothetical protein
MENIKTINIEINKPYNDTINAVQGDNSRYLLFNLLDNGVPFNLTNRSVRAWGVKPDNTKVYNDLTIVNAIAGQAKLQLTTQMLAVVGICKLQLEITEWMSILSTIPFTLTVTENIKDNTAVESTNEFSALQVALANADIAKETYINGASALEATYAPRLNTTEKFLTDIMSKIKYVSATDSFDVSDILISAMSDSNISEIDLIGKTYIVTKSIETTKLVRNGKLILKGAGQINIKSGSFIKDIELIMDSLTFTAKEALLVEGMNAKADNVRIKSNGSSVINTIGLHVRGTNLTCFNVLTNIHISYARTGVYIDSTLGWVTATTMNNIRVDNFQEYAFRIGADSGNAQNSQHNISSLIIQDTSDSLEVSNRIGLSVGGTWNNINNIIIFSDRPIGTFIAFQMPSLPSTTPEYLIALLKTTQNNSITNIVMEGNPNCNGVEYLHSLKNVRILRSNKIGTSEAITIESNDIKPLFALSDNPTIVIPSSIQNSMITPGNITYTYANGTIKLKNNTSSTVYFKLYIKIPTNVVSKIKNGKYSTQLVYSKNGDFVMSIRSLTTRLTTESVGRLTIPDGNKLSFYAFENTDLIKTTCDADDLYIEIGYPSIIGNTTAEINAIQFYEQLVPIVNDNNKSWLGTTNLFS